MPRATAIRAAGVQMGNKGAKGTPAAEPNRNVTKIGNQELHKKLRSGVAYNLKILIRGDRRVGKTSLLERLQGKAFRTDYVPTPEIQTAHITWTYKTSDEAVKVEVWDVVDEGIDPADAPKRLDSDDAPAGIPSSAKSHQLGANRLGLLDASTVDVYAGCHGVILLFNPAQRSTFEYAQREASAVPVGAPLALVSNFRDLEDAERVVAFAEVEHFCRGLQQARSEQGGGSVHCFEASLNNCFGLKVLYSYLNVPFLQLKQDVLLKQLAQCEEEAILADQEVAAYLEAMDYDQYSQWYREKGGGKRPTPQEQQQKQALDQSQQHTAEIAVTSSKTTYKPIFSGSRNVGRVEKNETDHSKGGLSLSHRQPQSSNVETNSILEPGAELWRKQQQGANLITVASGSSGEVTGFVPSTKDRKALDDFFADGDSDDDGDSRTFAREEERRRIAQFLLSNDSEPPCTQNQVEATPSPTSSTVRSSQRSENSGVPTSSSLDAFFADDASDDEGVSGQANQINAPGKDRYYSSSDDDAGVDDSAGGELLLSDDRAATSANLVATGSDHRPMPADVPLAANQSQSGLSAAVMAAIAQANETAMESISASGTEGQVGVDRLQATDSSQKEHSQQHQHGSSDDESAGEQGSLARNSSSSRRSKGSSSSSRHRRHRRDDKDGSGSRDGERRRRHRRHHRREDGEHERKERSRRHRSRRDKDKSTTSSGKHVRDQTAEDDL